MKLRFTKLLFIFMLILCGHTIIGQKQKTGIEKATNNPATFTISKTDFDNLFSKQVNEVIRVPKNKYINNSNVLMNSLNGDMKFMKIKLNFFKNAFLIVQVNGVYSTQIFILSEDKSVFYKGTIEKGNVIMTKCNEDDIVSE